MTSPRHGQRTRHVVDIPADVAAAVDSHARDTQQARWQVHTDALREYFAARGVRTTDTAAAS
jgi:hypothetical protein